MHWSRLTAISLAMALGAGRVEHPAAQALPPPDRLAEHLAAVAGAAMVRSQAFAYLTTLSDQIGARLPGSPEATHAVDWSLATMKAIGLENVHAEHFPIWRGWTRGAAEAALLAPVHRRLRIDAMGWTGSTARGGADADVVRVDRGHLAEEMAQHATTWSGKVLLVTRVDPDVPAAGVSEYVLFCQLLELAARVHVVAVIGEPTADVSAGVELTHTGVVRPSTYYDVPDVSIAAEDQRQLERLLAAHQPVRLHIDVENHVTDGPIDAANVVGDLRGTETPDEVFVVGGHLDSWDLAQGATDNGCGVAATLAAAEAIVRSGVKPRRTLRFVLFNGEEEGFIGLRAYVAQHAAELPRHLGDLILDSGQGPVTGISLGGHDDLEDAFDRLTDSLTGFGALDVQTQPGFGTDNGPFILAGLPGLQLLQDRAPYQITHHSAADTLDKVSEDTLVRNAAVMAVVSVWIADRPARLATPWPVERTKKMLIDYQQDQILKAFGLWPFGAP